jgi:hypothetical protein
MTKYHKTDVWISYGFLPLAAFTEAKRSEHRLGGLSFSPLKKYPAFETNSPYLDLGTIVQLLYADKKHYFTNKWSQMALCALLYAQVECREIKQNKISIYHFQFIHM